MQLIYYYETTIYLFPYPTEVILGSHSMVHYFRGQIPVAFTTTTDYDQCEAVKLAEIQMSLPVSTVIKTKPQPIIQYPIKFDQIKLSKKKFHVFVILFVVNGCE